ncbi:MAG: hypothetical protein MI864_21155 [Pseudomonadales bacterium]|nr:hypothetical protein [Pseudomonadales bacterium]
MANVKAALSFLILIAFCPGAQASSAAGFPEGVSPSDVYASVDTSNSILDLMLVEKKIAVPELLQAQESRVEPMHVYQLHIAILDRLYETLRATGLRPPPKVSTSSINYVPADVIILSNMVQEHIRKWGEHINSTPIVPEYVYVNKTPTDVFRLLFTVYQKVMLLSGFDKITPNEVYEAISVARKDLQTTLAEYSKLLPDSRQRDKRLLLTAIYGTHPDGSVLPEKVEGKKPSDVYGKLLDVRRKMNDIRRNFDLEPIPAPNPIERIVQPGDVLLQSYIVSAELALMKGTLNTLNSPQKGKRVQGKTPSDVYQAALHLEYMLDRLSGILEG